MKKHVFYLMSSALLVACGSDKKDVKDAKAETPAASTVVPSSSKDAASAVVAPKIDENRPVAAKYGAHVIYQDEITDILKKQNVPEEKKSDVYRQYLKGLLTMRLLGAAAKGKNMDQDPEIRTALDFQINQILVQAYLSKEAENRVSAKNVDEFYQAKKDQFAQEKMITFKQIILSKENKDKAQRIISALGQGQKIEDLAKQHSLRPQQVSVGPVLESDLPKEMQEVVAKLRPGEHTPRAIDSAVASVIVLLDKREPASEEVVKKRKVEPFLRQQALKAVLKDAVAQFPVEASDQKGDKFNPFAEELGQDKAAS